MSEALTATPNPRNNEPISFVAVDQSFDAKMAARDKANEQFIADANEGGRFKKMVKNVWNGALQEFEKNKRERGALNAIRESGNINHFEGLTDEEAERTKFATLDRFLKENDDFVHRDAGETREQLESENDLVIGLKDLIKQNVRGDISREALLEERTRLMNDYYKTHGSDMAKRGLTRVDNILGVVEAVEDAVCHGQSLDNVVDGMRFVVGESRSGVRTEAQYGKAEKAIDKLAHSKFGSLIGPELTVSALSIGWSLINKGTHIAVSKGSHFGAAAFSWTGIGFVAGAAVGGGWAALRESKRSKDDRTQHLREMAQGSTIEDGSERRNKYEATRYDSKSAKELADTLHQLFGEESFFGTNVDNLDITSPDGHDTLRAALASLSAVEARIKLSDARKIDLITFSATSSVERERMALDEARILAKSAAAAKLEANPDLRQIVGIDDAFTFEDLINASSEAQIANMEGDISFKDEAFNALKRRNIRNAAIKGAAFGEVFGILGQEVGTALIGHQEGILAAIGLMHGGHNDGEVHRTLLAGLLDRPHHDGTYNTFGLGENGHVSISGDMHLGMAADGSTFIEGSDGHMIVEHLTLDTNGHFTSDSLQALKSAGIDIKDMSTTVPTMHTEVADHLSVGEYMTMHNGETVPVTRDLWFDNDTPNYSDGNELRILWGGEGSSVGLDGNGIAADGGYQLSIASMMPGDSFHDGTSVDWVADHDNLKAFVSVSVDGQMRPFELNINPDGTINIPPDSPVAQLFGVDNSGHAVFTGQYFEVAQVNGIDADGVTHFTPLSTVEGTGEAQYGTFTGEHTVIGSEYRPDYILTAPEAKEIIDMPPVIPIVPRQPLERIRQGQGRRESEPLPFGGYYGSSTPEDEQRRLADMSPRLIADSDAVLNPHEELRYYRDLVNRKQGSLYAADIDAAISASPELSNLPPGLKTMITIPVNAAGKAESDNIYSLLRSYAGQDPEAISKNVLLLHVNWFDDAVADPTKKALIDHTKAEIERARNDFPDLKIATVETEWKRSAMSGGVIGHVARKMNDVALLATERGMASGQIPPDQDVLLIRNDADAMGIHRDYLRHFLETADKFGDSDIFHGNITLDVSKAKDLPGMVAAATFERFLKTIQVQREGYIFTEGRNFGVRASTLAAVGSLGFGDYTGAGSDDLETGWRIRGARMRGYNNSNGYTSGSKTNDSKQRRISRMVYGAVIDSDSSRQEAFYRRDLPMFDTPWAGGAFDKGGYQDRDADLEATVGSNDDTRRDPAKVLERIRMNMEVAMAGRSEAAVRSALTFTFMGMQPSSTSGYTLTANSNGSYDFQLTDAGKKFMANRLTRDTKGKFDSYYDRKMRRLYNQVKAGSKRVPTRPQPQLIRAT